MAVLAAPEMKIEIAIARLRSVERRDLDARVEM